MTDADIDAVDPVKACRAFSDAFRDPASFTVRRHVSSGALAGRARQGSCLAGVALRSQKTPPSLQGWPLGMMMRNVH
jgi:hypothetical protein